MLRQATIPSKFPSRRRPTRMRNSVKDENAVISVNSSAKRALAFDNVQPPKRSKVSDEDCIQELTKSISSDIKLCKQDTTHLYTARQAFHTSMTCRLIGREKEANEISDFLGDHVRNRKSGSLYVSGAPGTGKTSILTHVLENMEKEMEFKLGFVNCMSVTNPLSVFKAIANQLGMSLTDHDARSVCKSIEKHLVASKITCIVVLDEIDHLATKNQDVLYSIFHWPQLPRSSIVLVGIANSLDLTDRVLPRLQTFKCQPRLMHFQPYTRQQIVSILEDRLTAVPSGISINDNAIQLCARKIASCNGDVRKALNVCEAAIETLEKQKRQQFVLKSTDDDRCNPGSPSKRSPAKIVIGVQQINSILNSVTGSRLHAAIQVSSSKKDTYSLPLQQVLFLCTLVLMKKSSKGDHFNFGKVYDIYRRICKKRQAAVVGQSEFHVLCQLVESRGFVELKANKVLRMSKLYLKIEEGELEHVMQDRSLLTAILNDTSVIANIKL